MDAMKWRTRSNICIRAAKCVILAIELYACAICPVAITSAVYPSTNQVEISPVHQPLLLDGTLTNYNNCVFVRWRGPALVVVVV